MALSHLKNASCSPVAVALQHVTETRRLLDRLITSSESFDYHSAKEALEQLAAKTRELHLLEQSLSASLFEENASRGISVIPFTGDGSAC